AGRASAACLASRGIYDFSVQPFQSPFTATPYRAPPAFLRRPPRSLPVAHALAQAGERPRAFVTARRRLARQRPALRLGGVHRGVRHCHHARLVEHVERAHHRLLELPYLVIERLVGRSSRTAEQQPEIRAERELEALEAALADGRNLDRRMAFEGRQRVLRVRPAEGESKRNRALPPRTRLPGRIDASEVGLDRAREPRKERELLVLLDDLAPFREHL